MNKNQSRFTILQEVFCEKKDRGCAATLGTDVLKPYHGWHVSIIRASASVSSPCLLDSLWFYGIVCCKYSCTFPCLIPFLTYFCKITHWFH